jgi:hypothetical protein
MVTRPSQAERRGRHEALRVLVSELLRHGFGAEFDELEHERYLIDNSGRVDVVWGATIIELKSDLRRELGDVLARMPDYLADASRRGAAGRVPVGVATDGATFLAYTLEHTPRRIAANQPGYDSGDAM